MLLGKYQASDRANNSARQTIGERSWLRFSVRTLMIAVAVVACCVGLVAAKIRNKHRERRAVATVESLAGSVQYTWEDDYGDGDPPGPAWLRAIIGNDFFGDVVAIDLSAPDRQVRDEDLLHLDWGAFSHLKRLHISSDRTTANSLACLEGVSGLESLSLSGIWHHNWLTDAIVPHLNKLAMLKTLILVSDEISDDGIAGLTEIASLKSLRLFCTNVTDSCVIAIARNLSLENLLLCSTHVTDDSLVALQRIKSLQSVTLENTQVIAGGISRMRKIVPRCNVRVIP